MSSPLTAGVYTSPSVPISSPVASVTLEIEPAVPDKTSSYLASTPSRPWLSPPQNPITCEAKLLYG